MNYPLILLIVGGLWAALWSLSARIQVWPVSNEADQPDASLNPVDGFVPDGRGGWMPGFKRWTCSTIRWR
jgi:hypothetical protein